MGILDKIPAGQFFVAMIITQNMKEVFYRLVIVDWDLDGRFPACFEENEIWSYKFYKFGKYLNSNPYLALQSPVILPTVLRFFFDEFQLEHNFCLAMLRFQLGPVSYLTTVTTQICIMQYANAQAFHELKECRGELEKIKQKEHWL